jgi:RimJ/RimL family protein N-acetyltransferase
MLLGHKVTLRAIEREDQRVFWAFNNDLELEVMSSNRPPAPVPLAATLAFFDERIQRSTRNHWFAIEADGKVIGACGLMGFDEVARTCTLGIRIGERDYWGHGFGRDAVSALLDYGFGHLNMHRVWLTVLESNERAIRSYLACGFRQEALLRRHIWADGDTRDEVLMGILRSDWQDARSRAD